MRLGGSQDATRMRRLTVPTNQMGLLADPHAHTPPRRLAVPHTPAHPADLDRELATLRTDLKFTSAVPIRQWIYTADVLKRQADQHHTAGDLEAQYLWYVNACLPSLAKCARILTEWLPHEHKGYQRLDHDARERMQRNAETIAHLVRLTREALLDARHDAGLGTPPQLSLASAATSCASPTPSTSPSASRGTPARSSLRTHDAAHRPTAGSAKHAPTPKRVSFAPESLEVQAPPPPRCLFRLPFARKAPRTHEAPWWTHRMRHTHAPAGDAPADDGAAPSPAPCTPSAPSPALCTPRARAPFSSAAGPAPPSEAMRAKRSSLPPAWSSEALPMRLTGPDELSLTSPRQATWPAASTTPFLGWHDAVAQHMSVHQQLQGFVPTAAASGSAGRSAQTTPDALDAQRRAASTLPPAPTLGRPPRPPGPRASRRASAAADVALPRAVLPGAEAHAVLSTGSHAAPTTESGARLRPLHLPVSLVEAFLARAQPNTAANLETCGLLLGREQRGALHVTDLVLPPQTGASDSCTATSEEATTALQLREELLTLGWIHTHPTQSCFLSSLDLHTHAGYQALLPEAVAVVCAPQHRPNLGVFRLTHPPGLRYILQCTQPAPFHAHVFPGGEADLPLYTDATSAHVVWDRAQSTPVRVRDLR